MWLPNFTCTDNCAVAGINKHTALLACYSRSCQISSAVVILSWAVFSQTADAHVRWEAPQPQIWWQFPHIKHLRAGEETGQQKLVRETFRLWPAAHHRKLLLNSISCCKEHGLAGLHAEKHSAVQGHGGQWMLYILTAHLCWVQFVTIGPSKGTTAESLHVEWTATVILKSCGGSVARPSIWSPLPELPAVFKWSYTTSSHQLLASVWQKNCIELFASIFPTHFEMDSGDLCFLSCPFAPW